MNCLPRIHAYLDDCFQKAPNESVQYDVEKCRGLAVAYCLHYANDGYTTLAIEEPFDLPILDVATGKPLGRTYNGIVDCFLENQGKVYLCDHKTASRIDDNYWAELDTAPQITHYWTAARQCGIEVEGFLWDVILKPGISPVKLTKKAIEWLENGEYCGYPFTGYAGEEKETPKMYGLRVMKEYIQDPERFFHRRIIYRDGQQIIEYLEDLNVIVKTMDHVAKTPSLQYRNRYACKSFGRLCDYHPICSGKDPERLHFQPRPPSDKREGVEFSDGALSTSQIGCHLRCRREWVHKYIDKIEPVKAKYDEALFLGSLTHKCLELFLEEKRGERSLKLTPPQ